MKKILFIALFLASPVLSEDVQKGVIGPFLGLNNTDNSMVLPIGTAQDLLNVDITPGGKSVKKRSGYAVAQTLAITTSAVHGVYPFYDSSGNDIVLYFNDTRMSASSNGGTPTVLYSSGTSGATWQCVDSQGQAYCASTARPGILRTTGATFAFQTIVATGTMVALTPTRLVTAGISATPNRIDFSKENDFTVWTVGSQPADPIQWTITAPGSRITHIVYAHKRLYWFKESSFGYIMEGPTHGDWVARVVSPEIGTIDNTSVVREDLLYFRGQDGHIYSFDGGTLTKLSRPIGTTTDSAQSRRANSLVLTSASDWVAGTLSSGGGTTVYIDTTTSPGNLQTTFPDPFTVFRDGGSTKRVWIQKSLGFSGFYGSGTASSVGGKLSITKTSSDPVSYQPVGIMTVDPLPVIYTGTTIHFRIESLPYDSDSSTERQFEIRIASHSWTAIGDSLNDAYSTRIVWQATTGSTAAYVTYIGDGHDSVSPNNINGNFPFDFDFWFSSGHYTVSVNDVYKTGGAWASPLTNLSKNSYVALLYSGNRTGGSTMTGDNFSIYPQTFTYTSAAQTTSAAITSWDSFMCSNYQGGGSIAWDIKSSAGGTYTSISNGATPSIPVLNYWQVVTTVTATGFVSGASPLYISDISQNWFEGTAADKPYATYFDNKILWEITAGAGATTNNKTLVWDLINQLWTIYDLPLNGFYVRNQSLYFGSASGGYIYKFGSVDSDNGSSINSYWKSKDFFLSDPGVDNEIVTMTAVGDGTTIAGSSVAVTYTINGSTSASFPVSLYTANTFARANKNLPLGTVGAVLNVMFGNNAASMPWEIFGIGYTFRPKPWNVTTP